MENLQLSNTNFKSILILHPKKYIRFFRAKEELKIKPKKRSKIIYYPKIK